MATDTRSFELRTYVAAPGKLDALLTRFRDHTTALFEKHGITNVGYWVATDDDGKPTETLIYLVAHASREAAKESWAAFQADPDWISVRAASESAAGGSLTASVKSVYLDPTDFSELH
ncbi:MAG: NIPSNAP family protein [Acidimicrobiaceae bacterium]|nr:NIPSNAP family protein [Acidimicrobiaceae bacterium]